MSSTSIPTSFTALGAADAKVPLAPVQRSITLAADQVLVKISYASFNPIDTKQWASNFYRFPLPIVVGYDFAGTVVAHGSPTSSSSFPLGSPVFGISPTAGCFAEYVAVNPSYLALRHSVPAPDAAAMAWAYLTAYDSLELSGNIRNRSGEWIYVAGAAGGVGHFAVQLALAQGLRVIGSASKPASLALLHRLGVEHVIDYSTQDVVQEVLKATGGKGAAVVFDPTGAAASKAQSAAVVAAGGQWVKLGGPMDADGEIVKVVEGRGATVVVGTVMNFMKPGTAVTAGEALGRAVEAWEAGKMKPYVSATVPFEAAAVQKAMGEALQGMVGKVVIKVAE